jgi:uncharacterized protein (DUF2235 family)
LPVLGKIVMVKNIVLCFDDTTDRSGPPAGTNVLALTTLLDAADPTRQIGWYGAEWASGPADSYLFLVEHWTPGDRIFLFGCGRGAYRARFLAGLLNTIGALPHGADDVLQYVIRTYVVPQRNRTPEDWRRVAEVVSRLSGQPDGIISVPVQFLGLWDALVPGPLRQTADWPTTDTLDNVLSGRHAVSIDEPRGLLHDSWLSPDAHERIEEVWFRGTHADIGGGPAGRPELAAITLDWLLDAARRAGLLLRTGVCDAVPVPTGMHALAPNGRPAARRLAALRSRHLPDDANIHASVDFYLHTHPEYWELLPAHISWADIGWADRSERLVTTSATT